MGIKERLQGKTREEKANLKGLEIVALFKSKKLKRGKRFKKDPLDKVMEINPDTLEIEIVDIEAIEGGIQVFARAWSDDIQIGFGVDGSVDIERFRIFNPPILVLDPAGDILQEWTIEDHATGELVTRSRRLREDPQAALLEVLEHNISVIAKFGDSNIITGKIGTTTSTFYPNANVETVSVDGYANNTANASWNTAHDATSGSANDSAAEMYASAGKNSGGNFVIYRSFLLFDTSAIPDTDTISSATLSVYVNYKANGDNDGDDWMNVVQTTPASNTAIVAGDFDQCGAIDNPAEGATRIDVGSITATAYNDFVLNATGIGWISKTSVSKFGIREGHDITDTPYAGGNSSFNELGMATADVSGTASDPKLVVEHAAAGATFIPRVTIF